MFDIWRTLKQGPSSYIFKSGYAVK